MIKSKLNLLLIGLLLSYFTHPVKAQQFKLKGVIIDETNRPIEFLKLILTKTDSLPLQMVLTDSIGQFSFTASKGNYILRMEQFGNVFQQQSVTLQQDADLGKITINSALLLKGVTVSGQKKLIERKNDKLYFNVENSVIGKGNNGLDVLQRAPSLIVTPEGDVMIKNKAAAILINGRKTNLTGADLSAYLATLNAEDIKRIEIQEVSSSEQEAAIAGGVINIVTKKSATGFRAIAKTSYLYRKTNYDAQTGGLNLNYGTNNWNLYGDISYNNNKDYGNASSTFNYYDDTKNISKGNFNQHNDNLGLRLGSTLSINKNNEMGIEGYYNKNNFRINANNELQLYEADALYLNSNNISRYEIKNNLWYVTFNYTLKLDSTGSTLKFIGDVGDNNSHPDNDVSADYPDNTSSNNHYLYNTDATSRYYTAQLDWINKMTHNWELGAGTRFAAIRRDNQLLVRYLYNDQWQEDNDQDQNYYNNEKTLAGYLYLSKGVQRHFIKAGLRIENTDIKGLNRINDQDLKQNYTKLFPSLLYKYDLLKGKDLQLVYKRSINRPSFTDLNPFVIKQNDFLYQIGNPNLQPLYIDIINLSFNTKQHSFSLFGRKTINTIQGVYYTDEDRINYYQPQNFGQYYETGIDHSFSGHLTKWLFANISSGVFYNSFKANDGITNKGTSFYNDIYLQFKLPHAFLLELFNSYQYRYRAKNLLGEPKYNTDLALRKSFFSGKLFSAVKVTDIFNTRVDQNTSYYKDFNFQFYQKRITRSYALSLQYTFDNKRKINAKTVRSENDSRSRL